MTTTGSATLLDQHASIAARDVTKATALVAAAYGNHLQIAERLLKAGADPNAKDETVQSAYLIATSEVGDDPRLLRLTLRHGADVASLDSWKGTGLIRAADRGFDTDHQRAAGDRHRRRPRQPDRLHGAARGRDPGRRRPGAPAHGGTAGPAGVDQTIEDPTWRHGSRRAARARGYNRIVELLS